MQEFLKTEKDKINYLHNCRQFLRRDCKQHIYDFIIYANNKYSLVNFNYKGVFLKLLMPLLLLSLLYFIKHLKAIFITII